MSGRLELDIPVLGYFVFIIRRRELKVQPKEYKKTIDTVTCRLAQLIPPAPSEQLYRSVRISADQLYFPPYPAQGKNIYPNRHKTSKCQTSAA